MLDKIFGSENKSGTLPRLRRGISPKVLAGVRTPSSRDFWTWRAGPWRNHRIICRTRWIAGISTKPSLRD